MSLHVGRHEIDRNVSGQITIYESYQNEEINIFLSSRGIDVYLDDKCDMAYKNANLETRDISKHMPNLPRHD